MASDIRSKIQSALVQFPDKVDIGLWDPNVIDTEVSVTPEYADWLKKNGKDVTSMQAVPASFSGIGPGKFAVQALINFSLSTVEALVKAGVPKEVALGLLPHTVYVRLAARREERKAA